MKKFLFVFFALLCFSTVSNSFDLPPAPPINTVPDPVNELPPNFDFNTLVPTSFADLRLLCLTQDGVNEQTSKTFVTIATFNQIRTTKALGINYNIACFFDFGMDVWSASAYPGSLDMRTFFGNIPFNTTLIICFCVTTPVSEPTFGTVDQWLDGKNFTITILAVSVYNPPLIIP